VGGVLHLNWLRRKGIFQGDLGGDVKDELSVSTFTDENEIPLSESLDKFTVQLALVFMAYSLAFLFMNGVNKLLDPAGAGAKGLAGTVQGMIWGFQFLFGFIMAQLLNQYFRGRGVVRAVSLIPWVTPGVLIALMWRWLFDGNYGVINDLLMRLGIIHEKVAWLSRMDTALPAAIITIVWQGIPFFALMILAGLQGISGSLYEAARVDGATEWEMFWKITLPMISPVIMMNIVYTIVSFFTDTTNPLVDYIYKMNFTNQQFEYAAAMSWVYFVFALALCLASILFMRKHVYDSGAKG
jgi:ABC-type polysaccharide transport system permease subunit